MADCRNVAQGQEAAEMSELDFEELLEDEMDEDDDEGEDEEENQVNGNSEPPSKKRRT